VSALFTLDDADQRRALALALLTGESWLSRKAGTFLGQVVVDPAPLTDAQAAWLVSLAERAGHDVEG
jgi:hypothetical protein